MSKRKEMVISILVLIQVAVIYFGVTLLYALFLWKDDVLYRQLLQVGNLVVTGVFTYWLWNFVILPRVTNIKYGISIKGLNVIALVLAVAGTFKFVVGVIDDDYSILVLLMTIFLYYIAYFED